MGKGAFLEGDHRDCGELQAFGRVEGHEGDSSGFGVHRVGIGDEGDGFEVGADEGEEWGNSAYIACFGLVGVGEGSGVVCGVELAFEVAGRGDELVEVVEAFFV